MGLIVLQPAPEPSSSRLEDLEEHILSSFNSGYQHILNYFDPETQLPEAEIWLLPNFERALTRSGIGRWRAKRSIEKLEKRLRDVLGFWFVDEAGEGEGETGEEGLGKGRLEIRIGIREDGEKEEGEDEMDRRRYNLRKRRHRESQEGHSHGENRDAQFERDRRMADVWGEFV
jgi:hypothetical protein